jgi:predicted RNase H-like HicB family nuclease
MNEIVFTVEADDDGYTAKAIDYGIFTEADDLDTLKDMIKDAIECHFEEEQLPKLIHLNIVKHEVMAL